MDDDLAQPAIYLEALMELNRSLSHDLRSRLGNLSLHAGLLAESIRDGGDPDQRRAASERYVSRISDDVQKVATALDRVMRLTRPSHEEEATFDLRDALIEAEALLEPYARERRLESSWSLPSDPVPVRGRRQRVDRFLVTQVVPAMRETAEGGRIRLALETSPVQLRIESAGGRGKARVDTIRVPVAPAT